MRDNETGAKSCAGITYFTSAMKAKGKEPVCFGRRGKIMTDVPLKDVVERSAKRAVKDDVQKREFTYACIGYSQTTPNMTQRGLLPLCDVGIRFTVLKAPKEAPKEEVTLSVAEPVAEKTDRQPLWQSVRPATEKFLKHASNFWRRRLEDYPKKFVEFPKKIIAFQKRLAISFQKRVTYAGKSMLRFSKDLLSWWIPR